MSLIETQNRKSGNGNVDGLRASIRMLAATPYFPVKFGCEGFGIHELDRLRGLALCRTADDSERTGRTRAKSSGYVRNHAAGEMERTALYEKILMCVLAVGGVLSIWTGAAGMSDLLSRWSGFMDLMGNVLR